MRQPPKPDYTKPPATMSTEEANAILKRTRECSEGLKRYLKEKRKEAGRKR